MGSLEGEGEVLRRDAGCEGRPQAAAVLRCLMVGRIVTSDMMEWPIHCSGAAKSRLTQNWRKAVARALAKSLGRLTVEFRLHREAQPRGVGWNPLLGRPASKNTLA